jgi:DNA modification methylase
MGALRVITGDCLEVLPTVGDGSVDAIVTDPPYGLGFMGKQWDDLPPGVKWARECLRVLKPGGHLLAFGGTRTYHRLACAIEDAGFEVRDCLAWLYGSGFPKSRDVSKAIDKAAGATREVVGPRIRVDGKAPGIVGNQGARTMGVFGDLPTDVTGPATPDAEQWNGWGTALKPAHEPIVLARKPLTGTVARNVLAHGTGALNVDATRIEMSDADRAVVDARSGAGYGTGVSVGAHHGRDEGERFTSAPAGRWPANVVLDPEAAAMLGAVSRFFYVAKASRAERNAGLDGFEEQTIKLPGKATRFNPQTGELTDGYTGERRNTHPTVKPIDLMRWLVRLITPPGGLVLDPFTGSGTTGIACALEGMAFLGIEREAEYVDIARARIGHHARRDAADRWLSPCTH